MKLRCVLIAAIAFLLMPGFLSGTSESAYFKARRQALMKKIEGVAVLQGAVEPRSYERFRQSNDFYYLSGVEAPGAMLLLEPAQGRSVLFLPERNPRTEAWDGTRLYPGEEARVQTGFDEVLDVSRFGQELEKASQSAKVLYTPFGPEETAQVSRDNASRFDRAREHDPWDGRIPREKAFQGKLRQKFGDSIQIRDLSPVLDAMRRVKDELEIQLLRQAGAIGALGFVEVLRAVEPGDFEYQLAGIAEFVFRWHGAMWPGFSAIAGSGPNSCVLHYTDNSRRTEPGDLLVLDFGPDYRYYQCDITRTFPVSGKFTEEQARVYSAVLDAYRAAVDAVRPGASFMSVNQAARAALDRHGLAKHLNHGVSHYVGMSTHDVGSFAGPFEPGVVVTVEPGVYLREKGLGVRIEDTVLVTPNGREVLSDGVPRDISAIESLMAEPGQIALPRER